MKYSNEINYIKENDKNLFGIEVIFKVDSEDKDGNLNTPLRELFKRMISTGDKFHENLYDFNKYRDRLYYYSSKVYYFYERNDLFLTYQILVPNPGLIEKFNLDNVIEFLYNRIFNPSFDENRFNKEKIFVIEQEEANPQDRTIDGYVRHFIENEIYELKKDYLDQDNFLKEFKKIEVNDLKQFFKKNIEDNNYSVFMYGKEDYKDIFMNSFYKFFKKNIIKFNLKSTRRKFGNNLIGKNEIIETNFNNSALVNFFTVKDFSKKDTEILYIINSMLINKPINLIHNHLRQQNNLIYNSYGKNYILKGILVYVSYINSDDQNIVLNTIKEAFDCLKDEKKYEEYKIQMLKNDEYIRLRNLDNDDYIINNRINSYFKNPNKQRKRKSTLLKTSHKDIIKMLDRIELKETILFKGDNNE